MEFVVIAYDGKDDQALSRRMSVREAHLEYAAKMKKAGKMVFGGAILDDAEKMIGSVLIYECATKQELDRILEEDPYVSEGVWQRIEIQNFRVAPLYKMTAGALPADKD